MMDTRDAIFEELTLLADKDSSVMLLSADQGAQGIDKFKEKHPDRFLNMGIAEQNTINVATGLTLGGKRVFVFGIASFILQRCYEQIKLSMSDMQLPITVIGMGSGDYYWWDGATHCVDDKALVKTLKIASYFVQDSDHAKTALSQVYNAKYPAYIGIGRKE